MHLRTRRETRRSNDAAPTAAPAVDVTTLPLPDRPVDVAALRCIGMGALLLRWALRCNVLCFVDGAYQSSVASSRSESSSIV